MGLSIEHRIYLRLFTDTRQTGSIGLRYRATHREDALLVRNKYSRTTHIRPSQCLDADLYPTDSPFGYAADSFLCHLQRPARLCFSGKERNRKKYPQSPVAAIHSRKRTSERRQSGHPYLSRNTSHIRKSLERKDSLLQE